MVEKVQNRAVCWVCDIGPKEMVSMTKLKKDLEWPTLERRRRDQCLILMFKVVNRLVVVTPIDLGLIESDGRTRHKHWYKFKEHAARTR